MVSSGSGMVSTFKHHDFLQFFDKKVEFFSILTTFIFRYSRVSKRSVFPYQFFNLINFSNFF